MIDNLARVVSWRVAFVVICITVFAVLIAIKLLDDRAKRDDTDLQFRVAAYCQNVPHLSSDCYVWAAQELKSSNRAAIDACNAHFAQLDDGFRSCLDAEKLQP